MAIPPGQAKWIPEAKAGGGRLAQHALLTPANLNWLRVKITEDVNWRHPTGHMRLEKELHFTVTDRLTDCVETYSVSVDTTTRRRIVSRSRTWWKRCASPWKAGTSSCPRSTVHCVDASGYCATTSWSWARWRPSPTTSRSGRPPPLANSQVPAVAGATSARRWRLRCRPVEAVRRISDDAFRSFSDCTIVSHGVRGSFAVIIIFKRVQTVYAFS